jgi:hypothetical protein
MKHLSLFESFRDKFESLSDAMNTKRSYKDAVASYLSSIMMETRGISEKSFSKVDEVLEEVENLYNEDAVKAKVKEFESKGLRPQFCAETIFSEL